MNTRRRLPFCAILLALCPLALCLMAAAPHGALPEATMDGAASTMVALRTHLRRAVRLLPLARAVLIAPQGAAGRSVLLMRGRAGWSEPAFFDARAIDGRAPAVVLIMSDRALDAVLRQQGLPLQDPDPLSVGRLDGKPGADLLVWPDLTLSDAGFHQDDAANAAWYGHDRGAAEIVGATAPELRSSRLRKLLEQGKPLALP